MKKLLNIITFLSASVTLWGAELNPVANPEAVVTEGAVRFTVLTPEMIRIEYSPSKQFEDRATFTVVNRNLPVPEFTKSEDNDFLYITTDKLKLRYRKGTNPYFEPNPPGNLNITMDLNGQPVTWFPGQGDGRNLKGTCRTLDRCFGDGYRSQLENGLISRSGWAVIDDSPQCVRADGSRSLALVPDETGVEWVAPRDDKEALDLYFLGYGHDYKRALKDYTLIAGKMPLPPDYAFGYWYSKYENYTADDYRNIIRNLKENDVNTDVLILDMDWHWNGDPNPAISGGRGGWTGWSWNTNLIPEPTKLLKDIHDSNLHLALNLHPALGVDSSEDMFRDMAADMGLDPDSVNVIPWKLEDTGFYKAFANNFLRPFEKQGVDFWWLDWQQNYLYPYVQGYNTTSLAWVNELYYRDSQNNNRRGAGYSRWAGWGDHRHPIQFSGDAQSNWEILAFEVKLTSGSGQGGCYYWAHDIGGFRGKPNPELTVRWTQFGALSAALRVHSTKDAKLDRRPWISGEQETKAMRRMYHMRSQIMPYVYSSVWQTHNTMVPLNRNMFIDYGEQPESFDQPQQFTFGDILLAAPITSPGEGADKTASQKVWFPAGEVWYDYFTHERKEGGHTENVAKPLDEFPLYVRGG